MRKVLLILVVVLGILGVTGAAMAEPGGSVTLQASLSGVRPH